MIRFWYAKSANGKCSLCKELITPRFAKKIIMFSDNQEISMHVECFKWWKDSTFNDIQHPLSELIRQISGKKHQSDSSTFLRV